MAAPSCVCGILVENHEKAELRYTGRGGVYLLLLGRGRGKGCVSCRHAKIEVGVHCTVVGWDVGGTCCVQLEGTRCNYAFLVIVCLSFLFFSFFNSCNTINSCVIWQSVLCLSSRMPQFSLF